MSRRYLRRDGLRVRLVTTPGADAGRADRRAGCGGRARPDHAGPGPPAHAPGRCAPPVIFLLAGRAPRPRGLAGRGTGAAGVGWPVRSARGSWSKRSATAGAGGPAGAAGQPGPAAGAGGPRSRAGCGWSGGTRTAVAGPRSVPPDRGPSSPCSPPCWTSPGRVVSRGQLLAAAGRGKRPAPGPPTSTCPAPGQARPGRRHQDGARRGVRAGPGMLRLVRTMAADTRRSFEGGSTPEATGPPGYDRRATVPI